MGHNYILKSDADPIQATEWLKEMPEYRAYRLAIQKKAEQKSGVNAREEAVTSARKMKVGQLKPAPISS